jgi:hypothetical protein
MTRRRKASPTKKTTVTSSRSKQTPWPFISEDGPVSVAISYVDAILDKIRLNKIKEFDAASITQLKSLTTVEIKSLNRQYESTFAAMKEAIGGDAFCLEAYNHFTKPQLKIAVEHLKQIKSLKHDDSSSKLRKATVRKKKEKAPTLVVKKVLYMEKDPETGVQGIKPEALVGAQQMWVYNTKTRKLGCYYAKNDAGLTAKGTTILNYHPDKSTVKTLRKPKEQLWKFISGGLKFWDSIKAVPQEISPRLNRETLILKVAS